MHRKMSTLQFFGFIIINRKLSEVAKGDSLDHQLYVIRAQRKFFKIQNRPVIFNFSLYLPTVSCIDVMFCTSISDCALILKMLFDSILNMLVAMMISEQVIWICILPARTLPGQSRVNEGQHQIKGNTSYVSLSWRITALY